MAFFPDEVQVDTPSHYTKLKKGITTLRILDSAFFFLETWLENDDGSRAPKRFELGSEVDSSELGPDGVKTVMAVPVYNYGEESVQIWTVPQKTIMKAIKAYTENEKYGDPTGYDLNIDRTGEGKKTRYSVIADPSEDLSDEVKEAWDKVEIDLETLLVNGDPFLE